MSPTSCDVRGCPHRFRLFTLDWPWRCPEHRAAHDDDEDRKHRDLTRLTRFTRPKGITR